MVLRAKPDLPMAFEKGMPPFAFHPFPPFYDVLIMCTCVSVHGCAHVRSCAQGDRKLLDLLKLEFQEVVGCLGTEQQ